MFQWLKCTLYSQRNAVKQVVESQSARHTPGDRVFRGYIVLGNNEYRSFKEESMFLTIKCPTFFLTNFRISWPLNMLNHWFTLIIGRNNGKIVLYNKICDMAQSENFFSTKMRLISIALLWFYREQSFPAKKQNNYITVLGIKK